MLPTLVASLFAAICAAMVGVAVRRRLLVRASRLRRVVQAAASGETGERPVDAATDEVGQLAVAIDAMIRAHGERVRQLEADAAAAQAAQAAAEEADRAKSRFLADLGHDLRTPLNAILGYAQLLQDEQDTSPSQAGQLQKIRCAGEGLLATIDDVLELSRIEARLVELRPHATDVRLLVRRVAEMGRAAADRKGLEFSCDVDAELPSAVKVDGKRLQQVLVNLLAGAVDRTVRGGVGLSVRCRSLTAECAQLVFEATDTAPVIEAAQRPLLFKAFERRDGAAHRAGRSGLCLAICQRLVEMMGGLLEVESRPGAGNVFRFSLEAMVVEPDAHPGPAQAVQRRPHAWRRILFVGAARGPRLPLLESLAVCGFDVACAGDDASASALEQSRAPASDLLLVDLAGQDASPADALQSFRRDPILRDLPLVVLLQSEPPTELGDLGADAVLHGAVEAGAIGVAIADIRRRRGAAGGADASRDDPSTSSTSSSSMIAPAGEELERLHELARIGNMRSLGERADYLVALDPRYLPFADRLRSLSQGFQSRAILDWMSELRRAAPDGETRPVRDPTIGL